MKRLLTAALLGTILALGCMANAQTIFEGDINPSLQVGGGTVGGASGTYHVVINHVSGNVYSVVVTGNPDGNTQDATVGVPSSSGNPPKAGVGHIALTFYNASNVAIQGQTGAGGNTVYAGPGPGIGLMNNVGGPGNNPYGTIASAWTHSSHPAFALVWDIDPFTGYVTPHGGNEFDGTFTLSSPAVQVVANAFQGEDQQWSGKLKVIPEGSSLAMLMPGLLPLGLVLRRRRR